MIPGVEVGSKGTEPWTSFYMTGVPEFVPERVAHSKLELRRHALIIKLDRVDVGYHGYTALRGISVSRELPVWP